MLVKSPKVLTFSRSQYALVYASNAPEILLAKPRTSDSQNFLGQNFLTQKNRDVQPYGIRSCINWSNFSDNLTWAANRIVNTVIVTLLVCPEALSLALFLGGATLLGAFVSLIVTVLKPGKPTFWLNGRDKQQNKLISHLTTWSLI